MPEARRRARTVLAGVVALLSVLFSGCAQGGHSVQAENPVGELPAGWRYESADRVQYVVPESWSVVDSAGCGMEKSGLVFRGEAADRCGSVPGPESVVVRNTPDRTGTVA